MTTPRRLQSIVDKTLGKHGVEGISVCVERARDGLRWAGCAGELSVDTPIFIASVTKLYTTALILRCIEAGRLGFETPIIEALPDLDLSGLHRLKGVDYTPQITVRHLLAHTSGLPDYFQGKRRGLPTLEDAIRGGEDQAWSLGDVLSVARAQGGVLAPGKPRKALYSDTNYQLLGAIIEQHMGVPYDEALTQEIFQPLGLKTTWLYRDPADDRPALIRDGDGPLSIPKAMASFGCDGGIVSTAPEVMVFLRAFFEGRLFDAAVLPELLGR